MKLIILGGGTGGISMAARMRRHLSANQITLVEPSSNHYYQPLWTLVGGGVLPKEQSQRLTRDFIPEGVEWIQDSAKALNPKSNEITLSSGKVLKYDYLILATGLVVDFAQIPGLQEGLGKNGLCSIYEYENSEKTYQMLKNFKGGNAVFTMPRVPIKCAGAPQKIMYLAEEIFRENGIREKCQVNYYGTGAGIFGVPAFAAALNSVVKKKNIQTHFLHQLVEVRGSEKTAVFEVLPAPEKAGHGPEEIFPRLEVKYDLLHVVPPCRTHDFVRNSDLANHEGPQKGWMKVDIHSLQNPDFKNVFGIGDVTGVPNSKTGAAIRKQAPVVEQNLLAVMAGKTPTHQYDGYSSCPLITSRGSVILAEFGYDSKLMPSFPMDLTQERRSMWILKRYLLPKMYWYGMLRGRM